MVRHRFSAEDLRRMVQAGILKEDDQVELLYAQSDIPEVWVVDLTKERVHVFREPEGSRYRVQEAISQGVLEV